MALTLRVTSFHSHALGVQSIKTFGAQGGTIGRQPGNDWVLPDPERFVSSSHAAIVCRNGNYFLRDLSTNGTFINGSPQPIGNGREQPLTEGDRLQLGEYEIVVSIDSTDRSSVTGPTGGADLAGLGRDLGQTASTDPLDFFSDNVQKQVRLPNHPGAFSDHSPALDDFYHPPPIEGPPPPGSASPERIPEDWDKTGFGQVARRPPPMAPMSRSGSATGEPNLVEVLYVTDRNLELMDGPDRGSSNPAVTYGSRRAPDGVLGYGRCIVSIPKDHRIGHVERPLWLLRLVFKEDPDKHVMIAESVGMDAETWFSFLTNSDVFLFIHGYNVAFDDAVMRTAQLKYDLQFPGRALCYSWPSVGQVTGYLTDANNAQWSVPHLVELLTRLGAESRPIHIAAHSMGNRVLLAALSEIRRATVQRALGQIMMAAPDVDADVFKELTKGVRDVVTRMTLYASSNDEALAWSCKLQGGYMRAGQTQPTVICADGVDTIDASGVATGFIQHSYYGDNRSVISDMHALLRSNSHPRDRFGMTELSVGHFKYWAFRP